MNRNKMPYLLIASSAVMFVSIFTMSYKLLGIGLLQWAIVVFAAFSTTIGKNFRVTDFAGHLNHEASQTWKERKRFKSSIYTMVLPSMVVGLMFVALSIFVLIFVV